MRIRMIAVTKIITILAFGISFMSGCATSVSGGGVVPGQHVEKASRVVILPVQDGIEREDGPAQGSGLAMSAAIRDTLIRHGISPYISENDSLSGAIAEARSLDYEYVMKAVLTEWEDNATAWSGRPDSAALSVELYDVLNATLVATATHREKASSVTMASGTPERFVGDLAEAVVGKLF